MGLGKGSITVLGSTHVVKELSFSMFPSIPTFDFDLILGSFLSFWGPNGLFLGLGSEISETLGLGLDHFPGLSLDLGLKNTHFPGLGLSLEYS